MRKDEVKVGQRLALASRGYTRDNYRAVEVEVLETGAREQRGYRGVTGSRVRYVSTGTDTVVSNAELWMPWSDFLAAKGAYDKAQEEMYARMAKDRVRADAEDAEIAAALDKVGFTGRVWGSQNHHGLLALAREVNGR